ncbi:DNA-binding transcriptional regulator, MarR family [Desulfatibacillum alkenivorans DSM 16219]|jgi:DNA-binding MarR family transcriptional regulator|uniref:DNA-binding transcriptional regulator, MarR family n=1 Tax=Desulfatibacillum alkenivorans DSM 16219 TaxID=1121393 RepID=A0A1M6WW75_9BACT|nr:MarR family transcriptional regulator [Desulfatibacillum alkenivorans]SHK97973.1 DNA-binding transcriptional regulator, MarR family [Desulfatibacillum alkenivorans DSM 16219]
MTNPDHIVFLVTRLQESAHRFLTDALRQRGVQGIEPSHGVILRQLHVQGPLTMSELARLTGRTRPTVTVLVRKLMKHGYVEKVRDPQDGRVFQVSLAPKARELAEDLEAVSQELRERLYTGFDEHEKQVLAGLTAKALRNFHSAQ